MINEDDDRRQEASVVEYFQEPAPWRASVAAANDVAIWTHFFFSSPFTNSTRCSTVSTARPASPIVIVAGFFRYFRAILSTAGGIVAEKSAVTRVLPFLTSTPSTSIVSVDSPLSTSEGKASRIKFRSASNPRCTILSASSITTYVHCDKTSTCRSMTSFNRPGVAMMISAPSRRLNCCSSTARYELPSACAWRTRG